MSRACASAMCRVHSFVWLMSVVGFQQWHVPVVHGVHCLLLLPYVTCAVSVCTTSIYLRACVFHSDTFLRLCETVCSIRTASSCCFDKYDWLDP